MPRTMTRGKQQVMLNYLPGRTFDFERVAAIARVVTVRGDQRADLNARVLIRRIAEEATSWQEEFRPVLRDDVLEQVDKFILLDPRSVYAELFPKVLWCQNKGCGRVFDYGHRDHLPNSCPSCHDGHFVQLRFVKIHRCGALQPLMPPNCEKCHTSADMALDTRSSERISGFRWICHRCNTKASLFGGFCHECQWPDPTRRSMDIEVHRAGRSYYAHSTVLLNIPDRRMDGFFALSEWQGIAAAKYLSLPELGSHDLTDFGANTHQPLGARDPGLSGADLDALMKRQTSGEITPEQLVKEMQALRERRLQEQDASSPGGIIQALTRRTGVPWPVWKLAGQEMLEATMPMETGRPTELDIRGAATTSARIAQQLGLSRMVLLSDYPIITATYGFSRVDYRPNECRLNPFPAHPEYGGKFPVFVDQVQADALVVTLDHDRVITWLEQNGCQPKIPSGSDPGLSRRAYFIQLLTGVALRETLRADGREARMVFGLLHTLSHLSVRQAALRCGLDRTSLSEYMLPRALSFALYCNHRFGATIGALTALFENSLVEWVTGLRDSRRCVYDPVCHDHTGNCHACTHLAETSCRFFNLNLSRAFLFGGHDSELGAISIGYLDPILG